MTYRESAKELQTEKEEIFSLNDAVVLIKEENERYVDKKIPELLKQAENALKMFSNELHYELIKRIKEQAKDSCVFQTAAFPISTSFESHIKELLQTARGHELFLGLLRKKFPGFDITMKQMGRDLWLTFRNPNTNV